MPNKKQDIGLVLLGVGSSFGVWSALNTSPVGMVQFGNTNPEVAWQGMGLGLATIVGMAAGIWLVYGEKGKTAAIATGATGVALFTYYAYLITNNPAMA